jgi:uncharacterized protein YqjF (DUF2071 family)
MTTAFRHCLLVNFAVDPSALARLLPRHLTPDLHEGSAFVSIVIAEMHRMRPEALPRALGITYDQVVYRAVVRCGAERGVTFLRSDANNRLMVAGGNALTFFRFNLATTHWNRTPDRVEFSLTPAKQVRAGISATYDLASAGTTMPSSSRFGDLAAAQRFLTELYAAFGALRRGNRVEVVRIARSPWESSVLSDHSGVYEAMTSGAVFHETDAVLDSVFHVRDLEYHWRPLELARSPGERAL